MNHGHTVGGSIGVNQAAPLLLMVIAMCIIIFMETFCKDQMNKWGFSISANEIQVDENLPSFYEAVKLSDADWMVKEHEYYKEQYGMKLVEQELADIMDATNRPKKAV